MMLVMTGAMLALGAVPVASHAQSEGPASETSPQTEQAPPFTASYADIADLADNAPLIIRAQMRRLTPIKETQVRPRTGRFYIEARTIALVARRNDGATLGQNLAFLADLPLDARNRPPTLKRRDVLLFARAVLGRPGELALVAPDALLLWSPEIDARLRAIVTSLLAPDAPAKVTGVRELVNTPGNLAGTSETQVFLATATGSAASLTIERTPGQPPRWGASFSELVAAIGSPPARDTLAWYRLACFLPAAAPDDANRSETPETRAQAADDYRFVIAQLGACPRLRH
jgi:hypothetical protein